MADSESDYKVGPGRPPLHTRFKKGQSRNPSGRSAKNLPALLADALNERVFVTIDGRHRQMTKREAIVTQMVNKSASADLRATKMLIDMMTDIERKAGVAAPPEPHRFAPADEQVIKGVSWSPAPRNPGYERGEPGSCDDLAASGVRRSAC